MKNLYTTLLTGAAFLLAGGSDAQVVARSKQAHVSRTAIVSPHPTMHAPSNGWRGGPPPNDVCGSVAIDNLAAGASLSYSGTTIGATAAGDAVAGSNLDLGGDTVFVFHAFTTTECTNLAVAYCGTDTIPMIYQAVLSLSCPMDADFINFSGGEFTSCSDGNATIYWDGVPAGTYYLPVRGEPATAGPYSIEITATACPVPPANDDCAGVVSLPVNDWCNFQYFSGVGATQTMGNDSCNHFLGSPEDDLWFSFVATASDLTIGVQGNDDGDGDANTGYDAVIELYTSCGTGTPVDCADATIGSQLEQIDATALTVGTTYYVRVFDFYNGLWPDHAFGICISTSSEVNIGIGENTTGQFSLYPNPGTGVFNLQYTGKNGMANLEVLDVTGRIVYNKRSQVVNGTTTTLDLTGLSSGNYNVRLTVGGVRTEQRLMVK